MRSAPEYFVQTENLTLFAYWNLDVLLVDLLDRRAEKVTVFKKNPGLVLSYSPTSEKDLRESA